MNLTDNQKEVLRWMQKEEDQRKEYWLFIAEGRLPMGRLKKLKKAGLVEFDFTKLFIRLTPAGRELNLEDE